MSNNKFVFVVCGGREHIETLHTSLPYLQHFSKNEIIVVTDSSRNEIPVLHNNIIDVKTPEHFDNHQASIYLKVGLNKFVPPGFNYCYLDTDIIALTPECDEIFNYKKGPVTFAADHCRMPLFSPSAVKCPCMVQNRKDIAELEAAVEKYNPTEKDNDPVMLKKKQELIRKFEIMRTNKFSYFIIALRFLTTINTFKLDDDTYYKRWKKLWVDKEGRVIIRPADSMVKKVEANTKFRWDNSGKHWLTPDGKNVYRLECSHLAEYIKNRFDINVLDTNFQHWNGGVFLFDDSSDDFLNAWFDKTMKIFTYTEWSTRDQGTLIATIWEFGLQDNPLLPQKFNFIADYNNHRVMVDADGNFTDDAFKTKLQPALAHVYHNYGLRGWEVWDYIEAVGRKLNLVHEPA